MTSLDLLAGIVGSDGHIYKNKLTFCVINKNKDFMQKIVIPLIKSVTSKESKMKYIGSGFSDGKYIIRISSVNIIKIFNDKYSIPAGAKALTLKAPKISRIQDKIDYLRGWIAGDGSVTRDRTRPKIEIWSKNLEILEWFQKVLLQCNINSRLFVEKKKKEHILRIGRKKDVKTFYRKIIIPHPDKQKKLELMLN